MGLPDGLRAVLLDMRDKYSNPPIYVTEMGCAMHDKSDYNGFVADYDRIEYLRAHIRAIHQAIEQGTDVRGLFVWSLMDNLEWASGFGPRFGLLRVDRNTLERIPKQSAFWYRNVIRENTVTA